MLQKKHVARVQAFRGIEYGKTLNFSNSTRGFILLYSMTSSPNYVQNTLKIM